MALGKGFATAVSALALVAMAAPAAAQDRHGHDHGHHGDRDNGGAVAGALIVGGIIGALLAGAGKKKAEPVVIDGPPPPPEELPPQDRDAPPSAFDGTYDEETAAERCASAAELAGSHDARIAQIDIVRSVVWNGKSWVVKGSLHLRDSVREPVRETRNFRCALKAGGEPEISFDGLTA